MCDFHSILGVAIGNDYTIYHDPSNSHAEMRKHLPSSASSAPMARKATDFEAEWGGCGDLPSDAKLIRNFGECPDRLVKKIRDHFIKLKEALTLSKHIGKSGYFSDFSKYSDVWSRLTSLPEGVTFPEKITGYLDLSALTSLPEGVTFPEKITGYLDLSALTSLPEGVTFPEKITGHLDLRALTSLPEGVTFLKECGYLYLRADLKAKLSSRQKSKVRK